MRVFALPLMVGLCGMLFALFAGADSPLIGRQTEVVAGHTVMVYDCRRMDDIAVEQLTDNAAGEEIFRFAPCGDSEVLIEGDRLTVNGTFFGTLSEESWVVVNTPRVTVNGVARRPLPPPQ
ncbi:MAG: hypothetical protein ACRC1H_03940 [Caldilineaceae bacterium]